MTEENLQSIFTTETLKKIFPADRSKQFFDALYGDAEEGAYDIMLEFKEHRQDRLLFEFLLNERPGKCMACNLTYGLPEVFSRHPIINIKGIIGEIENLLRGHARCSGWEVGATREVSRDLHVVPLVVFLSTIQSSEVLS